MTRSFSILLTLTGVIFLSGCAATYRPINPPTLNYDSHDLYDGVGLSYKYDVLRERGNKKYASKEIKKGVKVIAVKVTNNTDSVINMGRDVAFYAGRSQLFLMKPMVIKESIKQIVPGYLPYLALSFVNLTITHSTDGMVTKQETYPTGLIIGPVLTIGNMAMAGTANKSLFTELSEYNIINTAIQKGETVYGIIGVRDIGYTPITVKRIK